MITEHTKVGDVITHPNGDQATVAWYGQYQHDSNYLLLVLHPDKVEGCSILLNAVLLPAGKSIEELETSNEELIAITVASESPTAIASMVDIALASIHAKYFAKVTQDLINNIATESRDGNIH